MASITSARNGKGMQFGLIFFSSSEASFSGDKYRLVIESAKFADQHDFSSIWIPERHFTKDGWLYPNPAILQAALARETSQIHLRAGSVVMPLHNPIRVAEEWAMVDNLSGGRVGISFASGWHPNDFVFFPENYTNRSEEMYRGIQTVQKLWRGESIQVKGGDGKLVEIRTYPTPIQSELPIWITAAGNPKTFAGAGEIGANLLTHMYNQSIDELAEKIRIYRELLAKHGYDPEAGQVSVMLHTFIGADVDTVREQVQGPFCEYLRSASYLLNAVAYSRGQKVDLASLSEQDVNDYLQFVLDRLISTQRVLFGTPESCFDLVAQLKNAGVNEIACQLDFGLDIDVALQSLPYLNQLRERCAVSVEAEHDPHKGGHYISSDKSPTIYSDLSRGGQVGHLANGSTPVQEKASLPETYLYARQENALQDIRTRCQEAVSIPGFYGRLRERGIQLEASFQGIEQLWRRDGEALGQVRLLETLEQEADFYQIHPTLLDACFQVLIAALPNALVKSDEALYLPTGLGSFQVHNQPGRQVWSHALLKTEAAQDADILEGDVYILDKEGRLLVEACGLQLQRSEPAARPAHPTQHEKLDDWLYELRWEAAAPGKASRLSAAQPGQWLIFVDSSGVGQRLAELLVKQGEDCVEVVPGDSYQVLEQGRRYQINPARPEDVQQFINDALSSGARPCRGVLHLWSLDATPVAETSIASLETDQVLGVGNALSVIQALMSIEGSEQPRLWLITRGAQPVGSEATPLAVAQAPLWGLGRTCAMEHPELWGGLIDVDPQSTADETAKQLLNIVADEQKEDQVAFRQGQTYVARMVRSRNWTQQEMKLRPDASYLITGGLWGLGFEVARWLVQKGAQHLILLGRTALPPRANWDQVQPGSRLARQIAGVRELEKLGTHVHYAAVDVANEEQLTAFLQDYYRQGPPPIKGIIHAASVWQDAQGQSLVRPLANLNVAALKEVFQPKVMGGWLLHKLLMDSALDFFVAFSSAASLFGSAAQGNYAAAGAFLDALAHHLRAKGQPVLSIDWGAVSEIGFGATSEGLRVHEYWESHGIERISPAHVLAALELLIPQSVAQVGVIKLDWQLLRQFYAQIASLPLVSYLVAETSDDISTGATKQAESSIFQTLLNTAPAERQQALETYLCEQVAGVLRVPAARLDVLQPLTALGLDSLMAIELKNRLELELKIRIPIVTFLQGPSIAQFTIQVLNQINELAAASASPDTQGQQENGVASTISQQDAVQLLAQLDRLSDDQVASLLSQMLQEENHSDASNGMSREDAEQLLAQLNQLSDDQVDSLLSHIVQKEEL